MISEKKLDSIHMFMTNEIKKKDARIDDILYSPYFKDSKIKKYRVGLNDRKPNPGMLIKAIKKWNVNINKSFFIGDSLSDLNASKKVNLKFFYKTKESLINQVRNIIHK